MEPRNLQSLIEQTAALMERMERRGEDLEQRQQILAQRIPAMVRQSADEALQALPGQLQTKAQAALEVSVREYDRRIGELGERARTLAQQIDRMEHLHRHLVWKTLGAAACALLALALGGAWMVRYYYDKMQENRISAELLKLYNTADVAPCGNAQLCANVDAKGPRFGDQRQYSPIKPRR